MVRTNLLNILVLLFPLFLGGLSCAILNDRNGLDREACANSDWWELGRQDGTQGEPVGKYDKRLSECQMEPDKSRENLYLNGRNAGLAEYCQPNNGFEIGRTGQFYFYVCPVDTEVDFVSHYRIGRRVYQLEIANKNLNKNIESLLARIREMRPSAVQQRAQLREQIRSMKNSRAQNEKSLEELRSSIGG
ncbi:MAG: DUF2799 domain-containing protein [Bdellovibrionales bacterium]|nr:DUF2799 domain-containing protein [Bdellovibrionales bacterium]